MRMIDADTLIDLINRVEMRYDISGDPPQETREQIFAHAWGMYKAIIEEMIYDQPTLTPPNKPLTLEQLREMDGEPVYVVFRPDISGERSQSWALVNVDEKYGEVYLVDSIPGASCYYDEIWADLEGIYRRPPEGEEDT